MITIPTSELLGLITDVIGFAPASKDNPDCGILIEWDGEALHAAGYDVLSAGRSTWLPGEGEESEEQGDEAQDVAEWGSDDSPWRVFISAEDAREIVKTFKLPAKFRLVPLLVKCSITGGALHVERTRDTGRTAHLAIFRSDMDRAAKFPDVQTIAGEATDATEDTNGETFSPSRLAAFGAVRAHGVMHLTFGEAGVPSAVTIGSRFVGFIYSASSESAAAGRNRHNLDRLTDLSNVQVSHEPADEDDR